MHSRTSLVIAKMISVRPLTRSQIARRLGVTKKTVSNRLSELHKLTSIGRYRASYVILNKENGSRWFYLSRQMAKGSIFKSKNKRYFLQRTAFYNTGSNRLRAFVYGR